MMEVSNTESLIGWGEEAREEDPKGGLKPLSKGMYFGGALEITKISEYFDVEAKYSFTKSLTFYAHKKVDVKFHMYIGIQDPTGHAWSWNPYLMSSNHLYFYVRLGAGQSAHLDIPEGYYKRRINPMTL